MAKKYLSLERLTEYDGKIKGVISAGDDAVKLYVDGLVAEKADKNHNHDDVYYTESEIDSKLSDINTSIENLKSGDTVVKNAENADHATSADNATNADHATTADSATMASDSEKLGGQLPSYYAKASDIPTGALANKDVVSESDLDSALAEKVNAAAEGNHSHSNKTVLDGITETKVANWDSALENANAYTDEKVADLASTAIVDNKISEHNTSTTAHSDIRDLITELTTKVNNFLDVDDTTTDQLSEVLELIENNKGTLESLTSNKVNVSDIVDNLTTANASKVLSANQGVVLKGLIDSLHIVVNGKADADHDHVIGDITNLQTTLDSKANQTSLDEHTGDTTVHITSTERTNWNAAKTHADSAHAPSNAQENIIESIKVNGTEQEITSKSINITVPTDNKDLTNGAGYLVASDIANKVDKATTLSGYGITDAYTKVEIDERTVVDDALSSTSVNPVQNKVVNDAIVALTSTVSTNISSISTNTTAISNLQLAVDNIQDITSEEIQALFA